MIVDMRTDNHLVIHFDAKDDGRSVIIDKERQDVRLCDGRSIIKVTYDDQTKHMNAVLVDDIYVWTGEKG